MTLSVRARAAIVVISTLGVTLLLLLRFLFPTFTVTTESMKRLIPPGSTVLTRRTKDLHRGEVLTCLYLGDRRSVTVKRVVAVGGDLLEIRDRKLYIDGKLVSEPYAFFENDWVFPRDPSLPEPSKSRDQFGPHRIPRDSFFVLGDNRDVSHDSRYWGSVPRKDVVGRVIFVMSPTTGLHRLP